MLTPGVESFAGNTIGILPLDEGRVEVCLLNKDISSICVDMSLCGENEYWQIVGYCAGLIPPSSIGE